MQRSASFRGLKDFRILYSDSTDKSPGASLILSYASRICISETLLCINNDFCSSVLPFRLTHCSQQENLLFVLWQRKFLLPSDLITQRKH